MKATLFSKITNNLFSENYSENIHLHLNIKVNVAHTPEDYSSNNVGVFSISSTTVHAGSTLGRGAGVARNFQVPFGNEAADDSPPS